TDEESIVRPCGLQDLKCIQQYFVQNSQCSLPNGPAPDSHRVKSIPMYLPHVNVTFILTDVDIKGFNDFKIVDFYINKKTNTVLFEVEFRRIWVYSPRTIITYHRKGKEPLDLADYAFIEYLNLSLTLTAPQINNIDMSKNHVYTYVSDSNPRSGLGPIFTDNKVVASETAGEGVSSSIPWSDKVLLGFFRFFEKFLQNIKENVRVFLPDFVTSLNVGHRIRYFFLKTFIYMLFFITDEYVRRTTKLLLDRVALGLQEAFVTQGEIFFFFSCRGFQDGGFRAWHGGSSDHVFAKNPHHEHSIVTPCSIHDVNCIRGFFAYNTQCTITGGSAPDPYIPDKIYLPTPHANLTINKATGVLVMEAEFSSIVVQTPKCVVTYYRKGKESLETADFTEIEYKDLSMTLSIPDLKDPQLSGAHVYTYVADGKPKYTLGPGIYKTKDPGFQRALIDVESKVEISLVEIFVTQGPIFFSKFFQSSICDIAHY
ncbi:hypothetical protein SFRURICE_011911, partial [Spodoptera frugiperda]